jgi:hypothetical protein
MLRYSCLPSGSLIDAPGVPPVESGSLPPSENPIDEPAMPDESRLREQARAATLSGKLPSQTPNRTWGGPGIGAESSVCRKAILPGAERIRRGPTGMHIECEKTKHYPLAEPERYRPRDHPCAVGLSALCWQGQ